MVFRFCLLLEAFIFEGLSELLVSMMWASFAVDMPFDTYRDWV